jgi:hypothetical protein
MVGFPVADEAASGRNLDDDSIALDDTADTEADAIFGLDWV